MKVWGQTGAGKLSKFGAKSGVKMGENWVKSGPEPGQTGPGTGRPGPEPDLEPDGPLDLVRMAPV